jgi:hypothetical protein
LNGVCRKHYGNIATNKKLSRTRWRQKGCLTADRIYAAVTLCVAQFLCILGGIHNAFWHLHPNGYVEIVVPISRFGGAAHVWVKPWIAGVHHGALVGFFVSVGSFIFLGLCVYLAKTSRGISPFARSTDKYRK